MYIHSHGLQVIGHNARSKPKETINSALAFFVFIRLQGTCERHEHTRI